MDMLVQWYRASTGLSCVCLAVQRLLHRPAKPWLCYKGSGVIRGQGQCSVFFGSAGLKLKYKPHVCLLSKASNLRLPDKDYKLQRP